MLSKRLPFQVLSVNFFFKSVLRSQSRGAKIKLPPGAGSGAEITDCSYGSLLFMKDLEEIL
jgi:hypothetical protein